jgi:hypothetical protein
MNTTPHSPTTKSPHAGDDLMTLKEVAALVRVPEATLRYWASPRHRAARLPHRTLGPLLAQRSYPLARRAVPLIHRPASHRCAVPVRCRIIRATA